MQQLDSGIVWGQSRTTSHSTHRAERPHAERSSPTPYLERTTWTGVRTTLFLPLRPETVTTRSEGKRVGREFPNFEILIFARVRVPRPITSPSWHLFLRQIPPTRPFQRNQVSRPSD